MGYAFRSLVKYVTAIPAGYTSRHLFDLTNFVSPSAPQSPADPRPAPRGLLPSAQTSAKTEPLLLASVLPGTRAHASSVFLEDRGLVGQRSKRAPSSRRPRSAAAESL